MSGERRASLSPAGKGTGGWGRRLPPTLGLEGELLPGGILVAKAMEELGHGEGGKMGTEGKILLAPVHSPMRLLHGM